MKRFNRLTRLKPIVLYVTLTAVTCLAVSQLYALLQDKPNAIWTRNATVLRYTATKRYNRVGFGADRLVKWNAGRMALKDDCASTGFRKPGHMDGRNDYFIYSNEAWGEKFRVRISLTATEQFRFLNRKVTSRGSDLLVPARRVWTDQDKYTNEWIQLDLLSKDSYRLLNDTKNPCWFDVHKVMRCLPYMYLIGAPKCGTTDLYERLLQHPDFTEPLQKEPHWITRQRLGRPRNNESETGKKGKKKKTKFSDYLSQFRTLSIMLTGERVEYRETKEVNPRITGDCSASTLWDNDIWTELPHNDNPLEPVYVNPHYVYKLNPNAKLIVLLRDPVARLYSDYLYFLPGSIHKSPALFHHQVINSVHIFTSCLKQLSLRSCVHNPQLNKFIPLRLRIGIYYMYLREWLDVFPWKQMLILRTEDYARNTTTTVQRVYRFLGLHPLNEEYISSITRTRKKNTRKISDESVGDMWPETRLLLKSFYSTFNKLLESLLTEHTLQ